MKVISKPDITAWTYKFTCQTCKSELQADYTDLKYRTQEKWYNGRDIDDGFYAKEDHFYVICPVCTKETEIIPNKASTCHIFYRSMLKRVAMKVLKKTDTSKWSWRTKCVQCESELEAERGDIKHDISEADGPYRPRSDTWFINCPVCSNTIFLSEKDIPKLLQMEVKQNKHASPGVSFVDSWQQAGGVDLPKNYNPHENKE